MRQRKLNTAREATRDARTLMFLADLFDRAAHLIMLTRSMAHPFTIAQAIMQVLRGKLWRGEIVPSDMQVVPALLTWVGSELQSVQRAEVAV